MRVSWEEAGILLRREPLEELIADSGTDPTLQRKFRLVLEARELARELGLDPGGSYSEYSKVDRDVLVWVMTASAQDALEPYVWWFPIVGSIPYKGYFEREDANTAAEDLREDGLDTYVRPSIAYSTLGWFDDPLLSTVARHDETALVDTVIHEIMHNTIWVKNHVPFNESLANFVGAHGSYELFTKRGLGEEKFALLAHNRWLDELALSRFYAQLVSELESIYASGDRFGGAATKLEVLHHRERVFGEARERFTKLVVPGLRASGYNPTNLVLNNASVIAQRLYLQDLELFDERYAQLNHSLSAFIIDMKELAELVNDSDVDPFIALRTRVESSRTAVSAILPVDAGDSNSTAR